MNWTLFLLLFATVRNVASSTRHYSKIKHLPGHRVENNYHLPLPHTYIGPEELPDNFDWTNMNGTSYLTRMLNQHLPQCKSSTFDYLWNFHSILFLVAQNSFTSYILPPWWYYVIDCGSCWVSNMRTQTINPVTHAGRNSRCSILYIPPLLCCRPTVHFPVSRTVSRLHVEERAMISIFLFNTFSIVQEPWLGPVMVGRTLEYTSLSSLTPALYHMILACRISRAPTSLRRDSARMSILPALLRIHAGPAKPL